MISIQNDQELYAAYTWYCILLDEYYQNEGSKIEEKPDFLFFLSIAKTFLSLVNEAIDNYLKDRIC